jgi:hypothetical protein
VKRTFLGDLDAKRVLTILAIVISLGVVGKCGLGYMFGSGETNSAKERVRRVFEGMQAGGDKDRAIALFYLGTFHVPGGPEIFSQAADAYFAWMAERKIQVVNDFTITDARIVDDPGGLGQATVIVSGTVNGEPFAIQATHAKPLVWVEPSSAPE